MKRALVTSIAVLSISLGIAGSVATVSEARGGGGGGNNNNQCENGRPTGDACRDNHNNNNNGNNGNRGRDR
jgi:hypothetical protein